MLCKNISKSVLAIEKMTENSTKNSFQDHRLRIDSKTPWRQQRSKSESSVHSFQDHSGNLHGDKKSGKSVLSRPSTKCAKNEPKSSSSKATEPQNVHKRVLSRPLRMDLKKTLLSRPLSIGLITLTLDTWSLLMRRLKSFQIQSPERRHSKSQNSHPVVCLPQDHNSTPSM